MKDRFIEALRGAVFASSKRKPTVKQVKAAMARPQLSGLKQGDILVQVKNEDASMSTRETIPLSSMNVSYPGRSRLHCSPANLEG